MVRKLLVLLLLAAFAAVGLWLTAAGLGAVREAWQSDRWPSAEGFVISSTVDRQASTVRHSNSQSYTPRILYAYVVKGETFNGQTIAPGRMWGSASAGGVVGMFPVGSRPPVYYSPDDPKEAMLVPGLHAANFSQLFAGLFFLVLPVVLAFLFLRQLQGRAAP